MKDNLLYFDFSNFWEESKYAMENYTGEKINADMLKNISSKIKYKLPESYLNLLKNKNGGIPKKTCYPMKEKTSWADNHIAITGLLGIDETKIYSLLGELGSEFIKSEWLYPDIGIYICDCPSAGHDMICLDYRKNGKYGEPQVVHVDQEIDYKITFVADTFEDFIRGLRSEKEINNKKGDDSIS